MSVNFKRVDTINTPKHELFNDVLRASFDREVSQFYDAIVYDVLFDIEYFKKNKYEEYRKNKVIGNISLLDVAPANSVLAKILIDGKEPAGKLTILYPMFPHMKAPIKPGEHVMCLIPGEFSDSAFGWWLTREHLEYNVEDANYTHKPRRLSAIGEFDDKTIADENICYAFPNGSDIGEESPDVRILDGQDSYTEIYENAVATKSIIEEAVPRIKARPGEHLIIGSNNSGARFGYDWPKDLPAVLDDKKELVGSGSVYLFAGMGGEEVSDKGADFKTKTGISAVVNKRKFKENDKDAARLGRKINPNEGNPDYIEDQSTLFLSRKTAGDQNYDLDDQYPKIDDAKSQKALEKVEKDAFGVLKSDRIRVVAREDGDIRLIKEGDPEKNTASIALSKDGEVVSDGKSVYVQARKDGEIVIVHGTNGEKTYIKLNEDQSIDVVSPKEIRVKSDTKIVATCSDIRIGSDSSNNGLLLEKDFTEFVTEFFQKLQIACQTATGNLGAPIPQLAAFAIQIPLLKSKYIDSRKIYSDKVKTEK